MLSKTFAPSVYLISSLLDLGCARERDELRSDAGEVTALLEDRQICIEGEASGVRCAHCACTLGWSGNLFPGANVEIWLTCPNLCSRLQVLTAEVASELREHLVGICWHHEDLQA